MSRLTLVNPLLYVKKGSESQRLSPDAAHGRRTNRQFTQADVPPKLWDVNGTCRGKSAEAQKINAAVDRIRVDVNRRYQELMQSDGHVTRRQVEDACLGLGVKREIKQRRRTTRSSIR